MPSCGVCLSVCLSVIFTYSVETSKRIFQFFSPSGEKNIYIYIYIYTEPYGNIPTATPLITASNAGGVGSKIAIFDEYLAIRLMTTEVRSKIALIDHATYHTDCHTSVNLVYHNQHGRPRRREKNRTGFNCTQQ